MFLLHHPTTFTQCAAMRALRTQSTFFHRSIRIISLMERLPNCPIVMSEEYYKMRQAAGHYYDDPMQEEWDIQHEITKRAMNGDEQCVALVTSKERVNMPLANGFTPLHQAAAKNNPEYIKLLVKSGATVDTKAFGWDSIEQTPLHCAAVAGSCENIKALVELGASLEIKTKEDKTPLLCATASGKKEAVETLIELGANKEAADRTGTAIHIAAYNGYVELVRWLASVMAVDTLNHQKQTALHHAAWNNHITVVKALVECGANVNAEDADGETPIFHAVRMGHIEIVRELVPHGAQIDASNKDGQTVLHLSVTFPGVATILVKLGADIKKRDNNGSSALHTAALIGTKEAISELVGLGLNVNERDIDDRTPLDLAVSKNRIDEVKELQQHGAKGRRGHQNNKPSKNCLLM